MGNPLGAHHEPHTHTYTLLGIISDLHSCCHSIWTDGQHSKDPKDICLLINWFDCIPFFKFPHQRDLSFTDVGNTVMDDISFFFLPHPRSKPIYPSSLDWRNRGETEWWMSLGNYLPALLSSPPERGGWDKERQIMNGSRGGKKREISWIKFHWAVHPSLHSKKVSLLLKGEQRSLHPS